MRNCPNCNSVTQRQHCASGSTCTWWVCEGCAIVFDQARLERRMVWLGSKSA